MLPKRVCKQVKAGLVPFLAKLREKGTPPDASPLAAGPFDTKAQVRCSTWRMRNNAFGFFLNIAKGCKEHDTQNQTLKANPKTLCFLSRQMFATRLQRSLDLTSITAGLTFQCTLSLAVRFAEFWRALSPFRPSGVMSHALSWRTGHSGGHG